MNVTKDLVLQTVHGSLIKLSILDAFSIAVVDEEGKRRAYLVVGWKYGSDGDPAFWCLARTRNHESAKEYVEFIERWLRTWGTDPLINTTDACPGESA